MPVNSPVNIVDTTVTTSILVDGTVIDDAYPVLSIIVRHEVNRISHAEIVFADGNIVESTFPISDADIFVPGNDIKIMAGHGSTSDPIFEGYIVKHSLRMEQSSNSLVVTCKHKAVGMTFTKKEAAFSDKKDSDIITTLIGAYGLDCSVKSTAVMQEMVFQKLATDWDFILSRAELYGMIVTMDGSQVIISEPNVSSAPVLRIATGESIISFSAELDAEKQATSISASAWDIKSQALLKVSAAEPSVNSQGNLTSKSLSGKLGQSSLTLNSCTPMLNEELTAWADGSLLKMRLSALKGQVSFIGNASVKTGGIIELAGVGSRFNGNAFVSAVEHQIEGGSWTTTVNFGLDNASVSERPDFSYPVASGLLPAIHGLQVATVKKLSEDPASQFRILINLVSNAEDQTGVWARLASFYASSGFGAVFTPEVGDEVIVGFLEGSPRYPVVLGSLYSDAHATPYPAKDENNYIKSLTTKSKLQLSFDDEKKITTILTPGGNSFMLNDDTKSIEVVDQNGNSLKMTSSGIALKSGKDISIEATGNIDLNATGKVTVTAKQDVAVSGANISNTANMGFIAKGNATAEVSASGQTTIKGGIVMIN